MSVELFESDAVVVITTDGVDDVEELSLFKAVSKVIINFLHVLKGDLSLAFVVNEVECSSAALL